MVGSVTIYSIGAWILNPDWKIVLSVTIYSIEAGLINPGWEMVRSIKIYSIRAGIINPDWKMVWSIISKSTTFYITYIDKNRFVTLMTPNIKL